MLTIKIIEPRASGPKALLNVYLVFKKKFTKSKKILKWVSIRKISTRIKYMYIICYIQKIYNTED